MICPAAARAWRQAVDAPLERGVRPRARKGCSSPLLAALAGTRVEPPRTTEWTGGETRKQRGRADNGSRRSREATRPAKRGPNRLRELPHWCHARPNEERLSGAALKLIEATEAGGAG
jgi:hypothetical protein